MTDDRALELAEAALYEQAHKLTGSSHDELIQAVIIVGRVRYEHDPKNRPASCAGFVTVDP